MLAMLVNFVAADRRATFWDFIQLPIFVRAID